jgi:integrase/recombinase XerD
MVIHRDQRRADARVVLDEFEAWLLRERSTRERTAAAYTARVAGFAEWLSGPVEQSLRTLTAATVIEWVNLEAARGLKASTLGKQMVMLRSFLQFCHRSGRTGQDFAGVVPHAASWRLSSIPDPVPVGTIDALFDSLDLRSPKGLRDRAMLLLLTGLGLRACEIAGLRLDDIGWQTGSLRIHGKGDRRDELPLPDDVGKALEDYVLAGRGGKVEGDAVFWTVIHPVQPLTANGVCGAVRQVCVNAKVTKFGPHRLRQTFATGALASGATLQEVQGLLRHAQLRTTAIYAKVDKSRLTQLVPEWPVAASGRWGR